MPRSTMSSADGSEHFWPNIKNAILQNPAGQPSSQRMKPQCPVCFEAFDITTFRRPSGNAPTCVVLFCGHVMCTGCLRQSEESGVGGEDKKCPCCRTGLACGCGEASKTFTVPNANMSPNAVFDAPLTKPENPGGNLQPKCHRCTASGEWLNRIDNGDWPREAESIEPGAVRFIYGTVDALESEGRSVSPESVSSAFGSVTDDEYQMLIGHRNDFISQRRPELESANPWFGGHREANGLDRYSSSSRHHERRREVNVDYRAPLDPPLDAEARRRRGEFEERRRIHDRSSGLSLGGESRFDAFGRPRSGGGRDRAQQRFDELGFDEPGLDSPRRSNGRDRAQQRFDSPGFDSPRRRDAGMGGMARYGDLGAGRETGRDAFSGDEYRRDTGNPYSSQRGRDTGSPYARQREWETDNPSSGQRGRDIGNGAPQARNTGSLYGDAPYGGDIGRDRRLPNTQREANPGPSSRSGLAPALQAGYRREAGDLNDLNAKFDNNPEAQRLFQERLERMRGNGSATKEELSDPSFIAWLKRMAVNDIEERRAQRREDGPSERRRW